ncbi:Hydin [Trypanosoma theileri]|uniref:Hydin n=1 Tax=Trypanosoma theileri TaxID=67003 RepID=A0A1X0P1X1_9TRYP|nr:Hydin [Trypanosoma theileri]ORC90895.1 Hydin [Trypanosoma theileri]
MYHSQDAASGAGLTMNMDSNAGVVHTVDAAAATNRLPKTMTFEVHPHEIYFREFEPHKTYEAVLQLKNTTKETQFIRVARPQSHLITLKLPRNGVTTMKVASGLSLTYKVLFTPEENRDYHCDLVVTTDHEEFTIPVHCIASRGWLALPPSFTVTPAPVKGTTETTLFLRNTGKLECQWHADTVAPFTITPTSGVVQAGGGVSPVNIIFAPPKLQQYNSSIIFRLGPEEDMIQELPLIGNAVEVNVVLEENTLEFPSTFVTLENQAIVRVRNDSDHTVYFSWKSDRTEVEEGEAEEQKLIEQTEALSYAVLSNSPYETTRKRLTAERVETLMKAGRVFDDDVFTLEPISGVIYAKGSKEFVVTFNPQLAMNYSATAYLDISGRKKRLPLLVKGTGMGPQCELEYTRLDIGDIFIGALHEYKVAITNKGCIEARFTVLLQDTLMGRKFTFKPSEGVLAPGAQEILTIQLQSDLVGLISETFRIHLHGSLEDLTLRFRGRVTGPSLQFNVEELDFGNVSYDCLHSRTVKMTNTGRIPIKFRLRIPDTSSLHESITLSPSEGNILPRGEQELRVDFLSNTVEECSTAILVDVEGVGEAVDSLPIKAACLVPTLSLSTEQLHYGTCFVGHEYIMNLELVNKTALLGKYDVIMLNEDGARTSNAKVVIGSQENPETTVMVIEPRSRSQVPVKLTPLTVGTLRLTLYVRVLGSKEPPLPVLVTAAARGPTVTVEPKSISFGTLTLLEEAEKEVVLNNTSPIPAHFTLNLLHDSARDGKSVFTLDKNEGKIDPYGSLTVKISARLDDARMFSNKIQLTVQYAEDDSQLIPVTAIGKGYALVTVEPIETVNFGDVFTETLTEKKIVIMNHGRCDIEVLWGSNRPSRSKTGGLPNIYRILPETTTIHAGTSYPFIVQASADTAGVYSEEFVLKDKKVFRPILVTTITGNFVNPLIAYSTKRVVFDYIYGSEGETGKAVTTKTFTMKNTTSKPLQVTLKRVETPRGSLSPFTLEKPTSFTLASGETHIVGVTCDALYRHDNIAHSAKSRILVAFLNHPFTEYVNLFANMAFPVIRIEPRSGEVNFGSILAETEKRSELTLTNMSSTVAAEFLWSVESLNEPVTIADPQQKEKPLKHKYFDFIPFRGVIPPGEKRVVEAVFYGTRGRHEATATCILTGGPTYNVHLIGWSDAAVRFDCTYLDFGTMHHEESARKTISITSPSHVAVPFTVDLGALKQHGSVKVSPMSGTVTNTITLTVTFCPVIPEEVTETFYVQVGHRDPQPITVHGLGQANTIALTTNDRKTKLKRVEDPTYQRCLEKLMDSDWIPYHTKAGHSPKLSRTALAEMEADRLTFCRYLLNPPTTPSPFSSRSTSPVASPTVMVKGIPKKSTRNLKSLKKENKIILSRYLIDFGHMTRQETRTTKITLLNTSVSSVALVLDRKMIDPTILQVEPSKFPIIPPFGEMEVTLKLSTEDPEKVLNGANKFSFFIDIKKGPRVIVEVRCFVAMPILKTHENIVDFGDVLLGHVKKVPLHFSNEEAVPCTWSMILIESKRKPDTDTSMASTPTDNNPLPTITKRQFRVSKDKGTLPPFSSMTVQLSFMTRIKGTAKAKLRLRYASNPNDYFIEIKGKVIGMNVEFSPFPLVFPPIHPCQVIKSSFTITNNEERPVEVFSMNYDHKYSTELLILQRALMMKKPSNNGERELHLPIRDPGSSLPEPLLDAVFDEIQTEEMGLEYKDFDDLDDKLPNERSHGTRLSLRRSASLLRLEKQMATSLKQESPLPPPAPPTSTEPIVKPQLVIITGPPFSGKTTQTKKLQESMNLMQLDLDAMVRAEAEFDTAEGELVRNILSEKVRSTSPQNNENMTNPSTPPPVENLSKSKVVILLHSLLKRHLSDIDPKTSLILDDVKSILTDDREAILFAIEKAVSATGRSLHIISLGVSEATVGLRQNLEIQQKCLENLEKAMTVPLSEEEYEKLSSEEQDSYNHRLLQYNKCKRDLTEATNEVEHFTAERMKTTQLTVQAVVDAEITEKEEQEMIMRSTSRGKKFVPEPRPKPLWNQLSEFDQYKELYVLLRRMNPTIHVVVDGEESEEDVNKDIVSQAFPSPEHVEEQAPQPPSSISPTMQMGGGQEVRIDFSDVTRGYAHWEWINDDRVKRLFESFEDFRFFSVVQRDVVIKKTPKGASSQLVPAMEETTRWIVPPKSSVEVVIVFCSDKIGDHTPTFIFGITGTSQEITFPVIARTAYPEISRDEKTIFALTKPRPIAGRGPCRVFVMSKRTYEFGPLVVCSGNMQSLSASIKKNAKHSNDGGSPVNRSNSLTMRETSAQDTLTFTNTGIFPAEISLIFGKEKDTTFTVTPSKFTLPVGEKATVTLRAVPETIGEIVSRLIVTVRDNPIPWYVNVSCIGTRPAVTLDGKKEYLLQYGRCLITREVEKIITIANISLMPTRWRISGMEKLPKEFELSSTGGVLDVNAVYPLEIRFKPTRTGVHNVQLKVEVTDSEDILFESLPLTIKAEAHDAVLEWTRQIDFKLMHVGDTKKEILRILNKGPYEVGYMLRLPKAIQGLITLTPSEGVLRGLVGFKDAALATIEVSIRFTKEGEIPSALGVIEALFFDPIAKELLYPVQTIPVTGEAWYNRYTIKPSCIDFGSCFADQKKQCTFEMRNTGRFPLNFRLFNYETTPAIPTQDDNDITVKKPRKSARMDAGFQLGAFTVTPSCGVIAVGDNLVFQVFTIQTEKTSHRETLGIYVDHCEPDLDVKGLPFELVASPTTPGIVADLSSTVDIETVFEEQQVVTSLAQCHRSMRVYVRETRVFSFGATLVGSRVEERFRIANSSPIACTVKVQLLPMNPREGKERERDKKEKDSSLSVDGFYILLDGENENTDTLQLPSFESRYITVCFAPPTLQSCSARFEAVVVGGTNPLTAALRFGLTGEGILPTVEYILPPPLRIPFTIGVPLTLKKSTRGKGKDGKKTSVAPYVVDDSSNTLTTPGTIQMPLTLVGMSSTRVFTLRNTGEVAATIRLSTPDDCPRDIVISKLKESITLPVGGSETFAISFTPSQPGAWRVRLRVAVTENPYEDRELFITAEGHFNTISLHNIDPTTEDHLTLGYWYVSCVKEHTLTIRNNSPHVVRFEWDSSSNNVSYTPFVGHMLPGTSKPITVRLYSDTVFKETLQTTLRVTSISLLEMEEWDNTYVQTKLVRSSPIAEDGGEIALGTNLESEIDTKQNLKKITEPIPEPEYKTTGDVSVNKSLFVSYSCDYASYQVTLPMNDGMEITDTLTFPKTKIFQRRSVILRVKNTGLNVLPFSFTFGDLRSRATGDVDNSGIFTVDPISGMIEAETHRDIQVTFAPRYVEDVSQMLIGHFSHALENKIYVQLSGSAECPLVHFNVPPCDYLETRIEGEAGPSLNPDTIPIMFRTCGLQSKCTVSFKVINPTTTPQRFEWIGDPLSQRVSPFRCLTPSGSISAGKQCEMTFEYTATSIGIRESKWSFFLTGQISVPFLLVGKAEEPNVFLQVSKVNFGGVLVGNKTERFIELENKEDVSFPFSFEHVLHDLENAVGVKPMNGVIPPNSKIMLNVWYSPKEESTMNAKLVCRVKRLSDPLTINVKGEGLCIHTTLGIEDDNSDDSVEPVYVQPSQLFQLSLGRVQVDTVVKKRLILTNESQCAVDYSLIVPDHRFIELNPMSGTVLSKQRAVIMLIYSPSSEETLRNFKIICKVEKSVLYSIRLSAVSYTPKLNLGFEKYDFGPCFITEFSSGAVMSTSLSMMNGELRETLAIDCILSSEEYFDLDVSSLVLTPGEVRNVKISFAPHEVGGFTSELKILINGTYPIFIPLSGEGVIPRIEVPIRFLKLGAARIGERRTGELRIDCKSRTPTPVSLANVLDADLIERGVTISPNDLFIMRPREVRIITVSFKPTTRMAEFQRELRMLVCGKEMPLAIISSSCEDAEVHLDVQNILFNDVVVGATSSRRVVIMNSGDISQRFKWDLAFAPNSEMKVIPSSGLVRAHTEQTCEFMYSPKKAGSTFRRPVVVEFDNAQPLSVNVEAHGVGRPQADVVVEFNCQARATVTKSVAVENPTETMWTIQPVVSSRLWTAPKVFQVNAKSTAMLPLTYAPVLVTKEKDVANLFIPLPTGSAICMQLEGEATYPTEAGALDEKVVETNTPHSESFTLQNESTQPLRFYISISWTPEPEKGMINVKMPVSVDVPPKGSRDCPITITSLKEGSIRATIHCRCSEREDYSQMFDVVLRFVPKSVSSKTDLVATVRTSAYHRLHITNPLEKNVIATTKVENGSDAIFVDSTITITRRSVTEIPIRFFPLVHKEYPVATVIVSSPELGTTTCKLNLRSNPPVPEKVIKITCPLGQSVVFPLRFFHYSKSNCEFAIRIPSKNNVFTKFGSASSVKAQGTTRPEGQEVSVDINYEPVSVGETRETIEVYSAIAGQYIFPVVATCLPPQRQGPFPLRSGQTTSIPFKNVFNETITLSFAIDSPNVVVPKTTETLAAKKSTNIQLMCKMDDDKQTAQTAKLTVSTTYHDELLQWVYYLKKHVVEPGSLSTSPSRRRDR